MLVELHHIFSHTDDLSKWRNADVYYLNCLKYALLYFYVLKV